MFESQNAGMIVLTDALLYKVKDIYVWITERWHDSSDRRAPL